MKITDIRVRGGRLSSLTFVEVDTDEGLTGIGVTGSPSCIIEPIILDRQGGLIRFLAGRDPLEPGRLWVRMFRDWQALRGRGGEGGMAVNAMGAVDMALWDLAGKALNRPLCKLLGGAVQNRVMAYASGTAFDPDSLAGKVPPRLKSPEQLAAESRALVRQGFRAVKFGWGNHFRTEDEERLAAIRQAIGPETRLMLDFGCPAYWTPGWNLKEAIRATRFLEAFDLYFLEEPMPPFDVDGYAALTQAVEVKIASGEKSQHHPRVPTLHRPPGPGHHPARRRPDGGYPVSLRGPTGRGSRPALHPPQPLVGHGGSRPPPPSLHREQRSHGGVSRLGGFA